MKVMIFGAGYSGRAIGRVFAETGALVRGTTRSEQKLSNLAANDIRPLIFDGQDFGAALIDALADTTHLIQSIAPGGDGDPLIRLFSSSLPKLAPKLEWIGYLSTVGVYGDHNGDWVNEETECRPVSARSVERVGAEAGWATLAEAVQLPLATLRLSGIYGPGRNSFVSLANGSARRLVKKNQVFNRIRVEDIAAAALFLARERRDGIFNVTDDEPAPPQDVIEEAARLMGVEPPPEQDFENAELTPMARSFYGENKRVSNAKIKALGFEFRYPNYHISLAQLFSSGEWNNIP